MYICTVKRDRQEYHDKAVTSLRKRYDHTQKLLDQAYEDKLSGKISEGLWRRKSVEWEGTLIDIQHRLKAHDSANVYYYETGSAIIELANEAYNLYLRQNKQEQRKLLNTLLSNCTFYRGTLCPTYRKPFDILAKGAEFQSMRG